MFGLFSLRYLKFSRVFLIAWEITQFLIGPWMSSKAFCILSIVLWAIVSFMYFNEEACFYFKNKKIKKAFCLWVNAIKLFYQRYGSWGINAFFRTFCFILVRLESACLKSSLWCSLSKKFVGYSIQEIYCSWDALYFLISLVIA